MNTVFITGASGTLGRYFAEQFAAHGWNLVLHGFRAIEALQEYSQQLEHRYRVAVQCVAADLTVESELKAMVETVRQSSSQPTVLINNAAEFPSAQPLLRLSLEAWDRLWKLNLTAAWQMVQHFVHSLAPQGGHIVNVASLGAIEIWKQRGIYNLTKQALLRLTQILAVELAPHYVVNAVAPGVIGDPRAAGIAIDPKQIPMQRFGTPDDVWNAVYFFSTCSSYITGQFLVVDGGFHFAKGCVV